MAFMLPQNVTEFKTRGEGDFYHFLQDVLRPDDAYVAWYGSTIENLEADFVVYLPEVGLIAFEVKDWVANQIVEANQQSFTLKVGDKTENRTNPLQQAKTYQYAIMNRIKKHFPVLTRTEGRFQGKSKIPIECGVVLTHITKDEFTKASLHKVLDVNKVLFADDLSLYRATLNDPKAETLAQRFKKMFPPIFSFRLEQDEALLLNDLLHPSVCLNKIVKPEPSLPNNEEESVIRFDAEQMSLAKRIDHKRAIIHGVAGSGKTVLLISKAIQELARLRQEQSALPVLIVCFNITLVHYLRRLIAAQKAPMGSKGIQVYHFYAFCANVLKQELSFENQPTKYYEKITRQANQMAPHFKQKYGAAFVDEGQDFSDDMISVIEKVLPKEGGMFWIACDASQGLYQVKQDWFKNDAYHKFDLTKTYRATRKLSEFCEKLMDKDGGDEKTTPAIFSVRTEEGKGPILKQVKGIDEVASYLIARIDELYEKGVPYSEMTILYTISHKKNLDHSIPEYLCDYIESTGILTTWVSQNTQSKMAWDFTSDCVSVSTVHSMKGLDSEAVFVLGLEKLDEKELSEKEVASLTYVACTRARRYLDIICCNTSPLIEKIRQLTI